MPTNITPGYSATKITAALSFTPITTRGGYFSEGSETRTLLNRRCRPFKFPSPSSNWRKLDLFPEKIVISNRAFESRTIEVVDYWHLPFPPSPNLIICNQICHKVPHVDSTGDSRIEDGTSCGQSMYLILTNLVFIDQTVRTNRSPLYVSMLLANLSP